MDVQKPSDPAGLTLEAWAQGFMVGALIIMACITVANMRRHVLLHKLILVEASLSWDRRSTPATLSHSIAFAFCEWRTC